jgi:predicted small metal-binding protein
MEYNTSRKTLAFPEYGRNVQMLVDYAVALTDPADKEKSVKAIIAVMGNLNPQLRDNPDFKHLLWDHLAIMSDFKLAQYSPYPVPDKDNLYSKPSPVERYEKDMKYPVFGRIIEKLMEKCKNMEDADRKNELIKTITNHMKKSYVLWNKENINDEVVFKVLKEISGGELEVQDEDLKLIDGRDFMKAKARPNNPNNPQAFQNRPGQNRNNMQNHNNPRRFYQNNFHK